MTIYVIYEGDQATPETTMFVGTMDEGQDLFGVGRDLYDEARFQGMKILSQNHTFLVGDGVSFGYGADSYPGTVVRVSPSRVYVARDDYKCIKPASATGAHDAEYEFIQHKDAPVMTYTVKKDGRVSPVGTPYGSLSHGRDFYMDPHF